MNARENAREAAVRSHEMGEDIKWLKAAINRKKSKKN